MLLSRDSDAFSPIVRQNQFTKDEALRTEKLIGFTIGRRKTAIAKVKLVRGTGAMKIKRKNGEEYLQFNSQYINDAKSPLKTLGLENSFDIHVETHGGGLKGQAEAIKLGVARFLIKKVAVWHMTGNGSEEFQELRSKLPLIRLRSKGMLTRDPRCKERKKYGLKKARKAPQFSKR